MPINRVVEIYVGRRGLKGRKQWFARVKSTKNGKQLWKSSEGYNNLRDLQDEASFTFPEVPQVIASQPLPVRVK